MADRRAEWPTALVSMPFVQINRPSIQLGLLKAIGEAHGFPVRTLHANLDFAQRVGVERYDRLADQSRPLWGDWLFSVEAFRDTAPDPASDLVRGPDRDWLLPMREHDVPAFLDELLAGFPWHEFRVVGFTSSFQQNVASFALARRLKERFPDIVTVFGGANLDGEMGLELVRSIDCIDLAVIGEGDLAFPQLLGALAAGTDPSVIPGVASRERVTPPAPARELLDDLPAPDYGEYFERAAGLGLPTDGVWLPFESARGCWWGAKHHCTFCGLNGSTMRFRSKTPRRVLDELAEQARRYRNFRFESVDNILDMAYLRELFPVIADTGADYRFFYEVKANLTRAQVKTLALGGVTRLQPGIESLSSHVLALMDKGVRAAQNVNLLRWARYYGIGVSWNILWGFPGETERDYAEQVAAVPQLAHLEPPAGADRVWLERFSPMFTRPDRFPVRHRRPEPSYRHIYPATTDIERVAYFFDHEPEGTLPPSAYAALGDAVRDWADAWAADVPPSLTYRTSPGYLEIYDARHPDRAGTYTFRDTLAAIYLACADRPTTARAVQAKLALDLPVRAVEDAFTQFGERGLMFLDGELALSLALPATSGR
jgi:ribosomal peptide maturation radical SAM protein 1